MKVYYLNDETIPVDVFVNDFTGTSTRIEPHSAEIIEVDIPEDKALFIKKWDNGRVLLASVEIR